MAMATTTETFVPSTIPFSQYLEQLEWQFLHNNYNADRYKTSFLAVCGTEVFTQLKLLFHRSDFKDLSYKQLTDALKKRFDKKDSDVIHTYKFWTRRQAQSEKSEDFVLSVKQLAERCDFGAFKERAIRDALVIGVYDRQLQRKLFDEEELTSERAEKLIVNQELFSVRTRIIDRDDERKNSVIARLGRREVRSPVRTSFRNRSRSRNWDHNRSFSPRSKSRDRSSSKVFVCSYCNKKGHTKNFCYRLKRKSIRKNYHDVKFIDSQKPAIVAHTSGLFKRLKDEMSADSEDEESSCMMISSKHRVNEPCYADVVVEKHRISMEVDCGSAESVISEDFYQRHFRRCPIESCRKRLFVIDGNKLDVLGKIKVVAELNGMTMELFLVVLRCGKDFIPLMGRTWLDHFYNGWRSTFTGSSVHRQHVNALSEEATMEEIKHIAWWSCPFGAQASS
ncbi:uncharacterized protein LOC115254665 [Aedes albopictus]|uniref:Retrotransposon gag domain-containing protein n=1 Tax=Aedes albopictus TaxID=7160 RepID=A0ABM1XIU7_AEDAL